VVLRWLLSGCPRQLACQPCPLLHTRGKASKKQFVGRCLEDRPRHPTAGGGPQRVVGQPHLAAACGGFGQGRGLGAVMPTRPWLVDERSVRAGRPLAGRGTREAAAIPSFRWYRPTLSRGRFLDVAVGVAAMRVAWDSCHAELTAPLSTAAGLTVFRMHNTVSSMKTALDIDDRVTVWWREEGWRCGTTLAAPLEAAFRLRLEQPRADTVPRARASCDGSRAIYKGDRDLHRLPCQEVVEPVA